MYGIFAYIYHKNQPNVGKYTIHGSSGIEKITPKNQHVSSCPYFQMCRMKPGKFCRSFISFYPYLIANGFSENNQIPTTPTWEDSGIPIPILLPLPPSHVPHAAGMAVAGSIE